MVKQGPNAIDVAIGRRLRARRNEIGISQERLGELLGVSFQQVGKYEDGSNQLRISRVVKIASIMGITIAALTAGLDNETKAAEEVESSKGRASDEKSLQLAAIFEGIKNPGMRKALFNLVKCIGEG